MAGFPMFANFWKTLSSPLRVQEGTRRDPGMQWPGPFEYKTPAAVVVNEDTAMQVSTVWACVRLLAETVASLPLVAYRKTPDGKELVPDHWLVELMKQPNRYQTRTELWESVMLNLALLGNSYCQITRVGKRVTSILPIMTSQVQTRLMPDGSVQHYYYRTADEVEEFSQDQMWHVKLLGNGIIGKSPLMFARNSFGVAQAAEQAVTSVYTNGGKRSGILTIDNVLTDQQRAAIKQNFSDIAVGANERLLVLEAGMQFAPTALSPQDIELLESRKFQIGEICRIFGVPPVLVSDPSGSTTLGSGIQQIVEGFYKLTLRPYLERFESSILRNLLGKDEKDIVITFDLDALLRTDMKSRMESYQTAIQGGIMTPNEARLREGLEAKDGGDQLFAQVNLAPLELLGENLKSKIGSGSAKPMAEMPEDEEEEAEEDEEDGKKPAKMPMNGAMEGEK